MTFSCEHIVIRLYDLLVATLENRRLLNAECMHCQQKLSLRNNS
jgi:hypothetical protein